MRFKPIRGNILFPGTNSEEAESARKVLRNEQISFTEMPSEKELSGYPNNHPLLSVSGRMYYGLEEIKRARYDTAIC